MALTYTKNYRFLLAALLGSILASFSYLIFMYNPSEMIIEKYTNFSPNSILLELWKQPPYDVLIKVYLFNVSNPDEFLAGNEKLKFNEVGPYVYKEELYNINTTFNENGTVSFTPKRRLKFVRELSVGDHLNDTLILPNVPLLGITGAIVDQSVFIQVGLSSICAYLGSKPFLNLSIYDYLYGYDDPLVTLANDYLSDWIDFSRFGILDRVMNLDNDSSVVTLNINPDHTSSPEEMRPQALSIQNWNGVKKLKQWDNEEPTENEKSKCGFVEGSYMGTIFPRNIKENSNFSLYRRAFCRPVPIEYHESVVTKDGFEGHLYKVRRDFLEKVEPNSENGCYCQSSKCVPKGVGDLSPCYYGIPIALSQPHFYNGDPQLLSDVDGLQPEEEKHDFTMVIHPRLGVPLQANLKVQINLAMPTTYYNSRTKPFNDMVLPLFWIDLSVESVPYIVKFYVVLLYHVLPIIQQVVMYVLAIAGVALIGGSALILVIPYKLNSKNKSFYVNYSQIPTFALKNRILRPDIVIRK